MVRVLGLDWIFSAGVQNTDLFDAVFFTLFALALVVLPWRRPQIYEKAPIKWGGKTGVMAIGMAGVIAKSLTCILSSLRSTETLALTVILGVIGAIVYVYYKYGKKDVDYTTIFTEIPPE